MPFKFSNSATATLASSLTSSATSLTVATGLGALFPALTAGQKFSAVLVDSSNNVEYILVTARSSDTMTITRAQEGSTARAFSSGDRVELRLTSAALANFAQLDGANTFSGAVTLSGSVTFQTGVTVSGTIPASISGNAATVTNGVYTTGAQSISGEKTFTDSVAFAASPVLNNDIAIRSKDVSGTSRQLMKIGSDDYVNIFNAGNSLVRVLSQDGNTVLATLSDASGNMTATGNVTAYSDDRVKSNWRDLPQDFIELLSKVKRGLYERTDTGAEQVGVSAQSLEGVLSQAVVTDEQGRKSVAYGNAALVACIELARELLAVKQEVAELKGI